MIIEAPTGAGKTETAILRALQLSAAGAVTGFYCAVPTRSAATELHDRVARLVVTHSPALAGKVVRAVASQLDIDPWQQPCHALLGHRLPETRDVCAGHRRHYRPAMLSTLRTTHAWLRHVALSRQRLIIDEVHASDPYMTEVIRTLVRRQLDLGGHALLMSATLGESMRAELESRPRMGVAAARAAPYPVVNGLAVAAALSIRTAAAALAQVSACVRAGGCALVIRATVGTAIETRMALRAAGIPTLPHHSRYADVDRQVLDARLVGLIGRIRQARQVCLGAISDWMPMPRSRGIAGSRRSRPTACLFAGDGGRKKSQRTARGAHNLSLCRGRLGRERRWQSGCRWFNPCLYVCNVYGYRQYP